MPGDSIWVLLGMLATVVVVLALAYFTTRLLGARGGFYLPGPGGDAHFRLLRQISVGRDASLALVRLGGRCLLLGVTAGTLTLLRELSPEESELFLREQEAAASAPAFTETFSEALKRHWPGRKEK